MYSIAKMKLFNLILLVSGASPFSAVAANELEPALRVLVPGGHLLKLDYFLKLIDVQEKEWGKAWWKDIAVPQWREYRDTAWTVAALPHMITDVKVRHYYPSGRGEVVRGHHWNDYRNEQLAKFAQAESTAQEETETSTLLGKNKKSSSSHA